METLRVYHDMIRIEGWSNKESSTVLNIPAITSKIALHLIASCGFGLPLTWEDAVGEKIRGLSLSECFDISSNAVLFQAFLPKWVWRLPFKAIQKVTEANLVLESIVQRIIEKRRIDGPSPLAESNEKDVFSLLMTANDAEKDNRNVLTDKELVANVFLLMLAGHETTSRALTSTLGLLACHPGAQDLAYQEIIRVTGGIRDPTFEDYDSLPYVLGCMLEGMRLFPSITGLPRQAAVDTLLTIEDNGGSTSTLPVKKGTIINMDFINASFNEKYYSSPFAYDPSRWLDPAIEQGVNFSYGPRVCVGKKFALTEGVAFLSMLVKDYKLEPVLEAGEDLAGWRARCLDGNVTMTVGFGPGNFPLTLVKRAAKAMP